VVIDRFVATFLACIYPFPRALFGWHCLLDSDLFIFCVRVDYDFLDRMSMCDLGLGVNICKVKRFNETIL